MEEEEEGDVDDEKGEEDDEDEKGRMKGLDD